jgi:multimeric flavodoxin WrbA
VKNLQILIIYDSKTGHTEKMAALIAEGAGECEGIEVIVKKVEATTNEDLLQAHGIIVGSPTYYGLMSGSIKAMFDDSVKIHSRQSGGSVHELGRGRQRRRDDNSLHSRSDAHPRNGGARTSAD